MNTKTSLILLFIVLFSNSLYSQLDYFGQTTPGATPIKFAENIISKVGQSEVNPMFTPDGTEFYYAIMDDNNWSSITSMVSKYIDGNWTTPEDANISIMQYDWTCVFSKNGDTLFHSSCGTDWQYDIFFRIRTDSGWSEASSISPEINDSGSNLVTSISDDGTIYFRSTRNNSSGDIYYSKPNNGVYNNVVKVDEPISTSARESHPTIAPDNSYMIFYRGIDSPSNAMYISFRDVDNSWSTPVKTGLPIHTGQPGAASITPDNKYLIYQGPDKDFYWVALENMLDSLKELSLASDTSFVNSTFIGSHGYFLESSDKKVALDAHIYWEGSNHGYIKPTEEIKENIENANEPFNDIDLLLVSHAHADHYNAQIIENSMNLNEEAILVVTPEVYDAISTEATNISSFQERIWVPELKFYESIDTIINEIALSVTNIKHGQENMPLYVYSFVLDNIRFTQLNSWNSISGEMYDTLGFNKEKADVAFLGYDYIMNSSKFDLFKDHINPKFSTISHVDGATDSKINNIQAKVYEYKQDYPMNLLCTPGDQLLFKKAGETILVDTVLINESTRIESNEHFEINVYPIPAKTSIYVRSNTALLESLSYLLIDLNGRVIQQGTHNSEKIDVSTINKGIYVLKLKAEQEIITKKVIIE